MDGQGARPSEKIIFGQAFIVCNNDFLAERSRVMKFHKTEAGLHAPPEPDGPTKYQSYPPNGWLSLVEASTLLQERGLMQLPPEHDVLHSGVEVTRLNVYLSGEKGVWWCVKEGKRVPSYNLTVFPGETFRPFFKKPGSKKEVGKTMPVSCGQRGRGARRRKVGTVRKRHPAPKNKKWVVVDGRAVLRCRRGQRRGGAKSSQRIACGGEETEGSYVRKFCDGDFKRVPEAGGVKEQKSSPVPGKNEPMYCPVDTRGQQLDACPLTRRCCRKPRKTKDRLAVKNEVTRPEVTNQPRNVIQQAPSRITHVKLKKKQRGSPVAVVPCRVGLKGGAPLNSKRLKLSDMQQASGQLKLINKQNDCFVNVGIQMMTKTCYTELPTLLIGGQDGTRPVSSLLSKLFGGRRSEVMSATSIRRYVAQSTGRLYLDMGTQEDAAEFLSCLEDVVFQELKNEEGFQFLRNKHWGAEQHRRLFLDKYSVAGECEKCGQFPATQDQDFFLLKLSLPESSESPVSLTTLVQDYFSQSTTNEKIRCSNCCPHEPRGLQCSLEGDCRLRAAAEKIDISKAPKFLFLNLLRYDSEGKKLRVMVTVDSVLVLVHGHRYELVATVTHKGPNVKSGHYLAHLKTDSGQWVCCNDEVTTRSSLQEANTADNYILLFKTVCDKYDIQARIRIQIFLG